MSKKIIYFAIGLLVTGLTYYIYTLTLPNLVSSNPYLITLFFQDFCSKEIISYIKDMDINNLETIRNDFIILREKFKCFKKKLLDTQEISIFYITNINEILFQMSNISVEADKLHITNNKANFRFFLLVEDLEVSITQLISSLDKFKTNHYLEIIC